MQTQEVKDQRALERLAKRLADKPKKIDNSTLYAGSSMYYYCQLCEHLAATLPESHWDAPPKHCKECKDLIAASGLTPTTLLEMAKEIKL